MATAPVTKIAATPTPAPSLTAVAVITPVIEEKRLRDTVNPVLWTVIGLNDCQWTKKTLEMLKEHGESVKFIAINREWQRRLLVEQNTRRVPGIFKGGQFIGSYDAVEAYYKASFITETETFE